MPFAQKPFVDEHVLRAQKEEEEEDSPNFQYSAPSLCLLAGHVHVCKADPQTRGSTRLKRKMTSHRRKKKNGAIALARKQSKTTRPQ
jgi:hypothetical protein